MSNQLVRALLMVYLHALKAYEAKSNVIFKLIYVYYRYLIMHRTYFVYLIFMVEKYSNFYFKIQARLIFFFFRLSLIAC